MAVLALVTALLTALTSCSAERHALVERTALLPPVGSWADGSAALDPIGLSDEPAWTWPAESDTGEITDVDFAAGVMVLRAQSALFAVDPASGAVQWRIDSGDEIAGTDGAAWHLGRSAVVQTASTAMIVVEYARGACWPPGSPCPSDDDPSAIERGIAAVSVADGSLIWATDIQPALVDVDDAGLRLGFADESTAIAVVASQYELDGHKEATEGSVHSVALDVTTGAVSWVGNDGWPVAALDDTVLAVDGGTWPEASDPQAHGRPGGTLVGLDREDGSRVWEYSGEGDADVVLTAGDYALVKQESQGRGYEHAMIDPADGESVADFGSGVTGCSTDGTTQVSCWLTGGLIATFDVDTAEVVAGTVQAPAEQTRMLGVFDGYVFTGRFGYDSYALDPTGADTSGALPGGFLAMNEQYAVFTRYANYEPRGVAVHEVTS